MSLFPEKWQLTNEAASALHATEFGGVPFSIRAHHLVELSYVYALQLPEYGGKTGEEAIEFTVQDAVAKVSGKADYIGSTELEMNLYTNGVRQFFNFIFTAHPDFFVRVDYGRDLHCQSCAIGSHCYQLYGNQDFIQMQVLEGIFKQSDSSDLWKYEKRGDGYVFTLATLRELISQHHMQFFYAAEAYKGW